MKLDEVYFHKGPFLRLEPFLISPITREIAGVSSLLLPRTTFIVWDKDHNSSRDQIVVDLPEILRHLPPPLPLFTNEAMYNISQYSRNRWLHKFAPTHLTAFNA